MNDETATVITSPRPLLPACARNTECGFTNTSLGASTTPDQTSSSSSGLRRLISKQAIPKGKIPFEQYKLYSRNVAKLANHALIMFTMAYWKDVSLFKLAYLNIAPEQD